MHILLRLAVLVITVTGVDLAKGQSPTYGAFLAHGSDRAALVSVEVTAVQEVPAEGTRATLRILHVYSGPKYLKGLGLFGLTAPGGDRRGGPIFPLLKAGETGLGQLSIEWNTGTWRLRHLVRKDLEKKYDALVRRAEVIERLVKLPPVERLRAAQELCGDRNPWNAKLGVEVLFAAKPEDAARAGVPAFLDGLAANRNVTASALVQADSHLFERDGARWLGSERRKGLLGRFTDVLTAEDAPEVADHVVGSRYIISTAGTWFTAPEAAALLTTIATDPRQPREARRAVVHRVIQVATGAGMRPDFTFDILTAVVRRGADGETRLQAAAGLARLSQPARPMFGTPGSYTPAELAVLRELLKDEKDPAVAKALQAAIDKAE